MVVLMSTVVVFGCEEQIASGLLLQSSLAQEHFLTAQRGESPEAWPE